MFSNFYFFAAERNRPYPVLNLVSTLTNLQKKNVAMTSDFQFFNNLAQLSEQKRYHRFPAMNGRSLMHNLVIG